MEALTAVQVGLLTIYDMCKAIDRGMVMSDIRVMEKRGGKSGEWLLILMPPLTRTSRSLFSQFQLERSHHICPWLFDFLAE